MATLSASNAIHILVVVDVQGALASTSSTPLADNLWMIDTGKYRGETEAINSLTTYVNSGDTIFWSLAPVDPGTNLQFPVGKQPFTSLDNKTIPAIINPKPVPLSDDQQYLARFTPPGGTAKGTSYQYAIILSLGGKEMTFDPYLKLYSAT